MMSTHNEIEKKKYLFGSIFLLAQRWQYLGDHFLAKDKVTTKQWLLLAVITSLFDSPPTLTQAAEAMGTSRQNVKQIALKLDRRGFIKIKIDVKDSRILRLHITAKNKHFWQKRADKDDAYIARLFDVLSATEIKNFFKIIQKLDKKTLEHLERSARK
jgi:DNA-binding MarR family transcriptional regulator